MLNMEVFNTLIEARVLIEQLLVHDNTIRPPERVNDNETAGLIVYTKTHGI